MAGTKLRLSSIDLVPEHAQDDIVWAIGELNQRLRTQADILFELNDRLATKGVEPISASAFNRKALKLRAAQIRLDEARHIFTGIADQFTPEKVDENSIVLGEFIKMLVFELTQADTSERTPKMAMELKAAFEDDMISIPRDAEVAADLRAFKVVRGIATLPALRTAGAAGGTRHGDAGIAIALAYSATRMPFVPYSYQPVDGAGPVNSFGPRGFGADDHEDAGGQFAPGLRGGIF